MEIVCEVTGMHWQYVIADIRPAGIDKIILYLQRFVFVHCGVILVPDTLPSSLQLVPVTRIDNFFHLYLQKRLLRIYVFN